MSEGTGSTEFEKKNGMEPLTEATWRVASMPYLFLTFARKVNNQEYDDANYLSKKQRREYSLGLGIGGFLNAVQLIGYVKLVVNYDVPEALLFPLATNVVSGIYEGARAIKNKSSKKTLETNLK